MSNNNISNDEEKKDEEKNNLLYKLNIKKTRIVSPILIFLLTIFSILIALGLSFAAVNYMSSNQSFNTIISRIKGDDDDDDNHDDDKEKYIISYIEGTNLENGGINLINQFPISDDVGKKLIGDNYVFKFTLLVGKATAGAYYEITADKTSNTNLNQNYVKIYLEKNGTGVDNCFDSNHKVKVYSDYSNSKYQGEVKGRVLYSGYITEDDALLGKIDFLLRMWISEDVEVNDGYFNKKFTVKINTYAMFEK